MRRRKTWERFCDWCSWHEGIVFTVIIIILSIGVIAGLIKYQSRFYYTNEPMIIEVTDKRHWTTTTMVHSGKVIIPQIHHHYSISSDEYDRPLSKEAISPKGLYSHPLGTPPSNSAFSKPGNLNLTNHSL